MSEHRIDRDSRGFYCLDCSWPGLEFTYRGSDATAHQDEERRRVVRSEVSA